MATSTEISCNITEERSFDDSECSVSRKRSTKWKKLMKKFGQESKKSLYGSSKPIYRYDVAFQSPFASNDSGRLDTWNDVATLSKSFWYGLLMGLELATFWGFPRRLVAGDTLPRRLVVGETSLGKARKGFLPRRQSPAKRRVPPRIPRRQMSPGKDSSPVLLFLVVKDEYEFIEQQGCSGTSRYSESNTMGTKEHGKRHRSRCSRSPRTSVFSRIRRERSRSPRQKAKEGCVFKRLGSRGKSVFARSGSYDQHSHSMYTKALLENENSGDRHWKTRSKKKKSSEEEDDLSQPWVCEETDPFTPRIRYFDFHKQECPATLGHTMEQKKYIRDPIELHNIKQRDGESTKDFMRALLGHFRLEACGYDRLPETHRGTSSKRTGGIFSGIMREVHYHDWLSNPVMVKKHDGSWRMCVDFNDLNKTCPKDGYPLPKIDWKVESLCGFPFKCFLYAYKGYHQIQMAMKDKEKTAFITRQGIFCYTKMPFGLRNAGATYHKHIGRNLEVYVDDIVIKSHTKDEIVRDVEETFRTVREINMKLNPKTEEAFKQMKHLIADLPMLTSPIEKEELIVYLAAAKEIVSVVLMTEREAKQMPIYLVSRALSGPELNYTSMEKLVLALVHASKRLKDFIVKRPEEDSLDTLIKEEGELPEPWILFTDGSSYTDGSETGLILTNPEGMEFTYALSLGEGIKERLDARSKNWIEELPHVLWVHRTMIKSSNGDTPFLLTYGMEAVISAEIGMPTLRIVEVDLVGNNEALEINLDLLEEGEMRQQYVKLKAKMKKNTITQKYKTHALSYET
nr:reverse transcriptase domain-containing protein [Tanacetum cinerariifolium]